MFKVMPCRELERYVLYSSTICQMQRMTNSVHLGFLTVTVCISKQSMWGSPKALVQKCCRVTLSCIFASCHHGLSRSLTRERIAAAGTNLNHADRVNEKAKYSGSASRALGTAAPAGLCSGSLAEMLT